MRRLFMMGCAALVAVAAVGQQVVVRKRGEGKMTINLANYDVSNQTSARTFITVLKADLARSGYFILSNQGAELSLAGSFVSSGNKVQANCALFNRGNPKRLLNRSFQAGVSDVRGLAHRVADAIVLAATGKPGMAAGRIALVGNRTGRKEVYIADMDGRNLKQITRDRSIAVGPDWTPSGKALIYTSYKQGYPNIYLSGRSKPLASYGGLNASGAISPDGKQMAMILSKTGNPELWVKNLRTGKLKRLTKTRRGNEASPCWSPDGSMIAYVSDTTGTPQVYIISSSGGRQKKLTTTGTENVAPDWNRNGQIVLCSRIGGRYRIAVADPAKKSFKVLQTDGADYEDPSWAPDGRHIVCSRTLNYRSSIYLLDTLEDSPVALISGSGDWISPACSP